MHLVVTKADGDLKGYCAPLFLRHKFCFQEAGQVVWVKRLTGRSVFMSKLARRIQGFRDSSGSFATLTAIRRTSSLFDGKSLVL
jgi:hypothetical protein